jgi:hypothetical protein
MIEILHRSIAFTLFEISIFMILVNLIIMSESIYELWLYMQKIIGSFDLD